MTNARSVARIIRSIRTVEGGGFVVQRPFPTGQLENFDPFLVLDEMGPADNAPHEAKGAPDHPHRGFETVTYLLSGEMQHLDSHGNKGVLRPGDVQWMTAGRGVIHSEMPTEEFQKRGGKLHGFQLWVNLPQRDKMMNPRYQDVPAASIPTVGNDGVRVRVIAGESMGVSAVIDTRTPIMVLHVTLQPGRTLTQAVPAAMNAFAYVIDGSGDIGGTAIGDAQMVVLGEGDSVTITSGDVVLDLLLIGGVPLHEPIVQYGPFVMNTQREIMQAVDDFQNGRFGEISATFGG